MSDLYRLLDIDSDDPEYGFGNNGTMYRGRVEPVEPDYEAGYGVARDRFDLTLLQRITLSINAALGVTDDE